MPWLSRSEKKNTFKKKTKWKKVHVKKNIKRPARYILVYIYSGARERGLRHDNRLKSGIACVRIYVWAYSACITRTLSRSAPSYSDTSYSSVSPSDISTQSSKNIPTVELMFSAFIIVTRPCPWVRKKTYQASAKVQGVGVGGKGLGCQASFFFHKSRLRYFQKSARLLFFESRLLFFRNTQKKRKKVARTDFSRVLTLLASRASERAARAYSAPRVKQPTGDRSYVGWVENMPRHLRTASRKYIVPALHRPARRIDNAGKKKTELVRRRQSFTPSDASCAKIYTK